jgi:competence protein ComGC
MLLDNKKFTFVELLIVIALVALIVSLLQPSLSRILERGRQTVCANNVNVLTRSHLIYAEDFDGKPLDPTDYLTADGFKSWPNAQGIPDRSLLIVLGYLNSKEVFMCPSDSKERKDGPSKYIRSASFSYTRNGYTKNVNINELNIKSIILAEEHNYSPMNDGTFYSNQWDHLSDRHDGWGHVSFPDGTVKQLDAIEFNQQTYKWRIDKYLLPN